MEKNNSSNFLGFKLRRVTLNQNSILIFLTSLYFLLSPIEIGMNQLSPTNSSVKYVMLIIILAALFKKGLVLSKINISILIWILFSFISISWSPNINDALFYFRMYLLSGLFYIVIVKNGFSVRNIDLFLVSLMLGSTIAALFVIVSPIVLSNTYSERYTLSMFGGEMDPNGAAALISYGYVISLYDIVLKRKMIIFKSIISVISLLGVLYTGSRGGLVAITLATLVIVIYPLFSKGNKFKKFWILITSSLIVLLLGYYTISYLPERTFDRLFMFRKYEGGSNRTLIWESYYRSISPIWGNGIGSMNIISYQNNGHLTGTHNTYLQLIVDVGVVGLFCFLYLIFYLLIRTNRLIEKKTLVLSLILTAIVPAFFLDSLQQRNFWIGLILAALIIGNDERNKLNYLHRIEK